MNLQGGWVDKFPSMSLGSETFGMTGRNPDLGRIRGIFSKPEKESVGRVPRKYENNKLIGWTEIENEDPPPLQNKRCGFLPLKSAESNFAREF